MTLLAIVFFIMLGLITYNTTWHFIVGLKSKNWPNVEGEITKSKLVKFDRSDTGFISTRYMTLIEYQYIIDTKSYTSQVISMPDLAIKILNSGVKSKAYAIELINRYPSASMVTVYYNPSNPNQAVIKPGIANFTFILMFLSFWIVIIGFLFIV